MLNRSFSASALTADMRILRIDQALEKCEAHLSLEEAVEAEVQSLLAQSLVILIYAEFEQKVRELIRDRCRTTNTGIAYWTTYATRCFKTSRR